ncbi:MAG TPA: ABC transporter ATP-binding protein [Candidatus Nitrosotenuis sp.]|nr:ABC transporter ATP-binding protein [Candidatus Nitrosotenuis sp.]
MIECRNLTHVYPDTGRGRTRGQPGHLALNQLNLRLEPGDCFGFIGPNGAGKTTTIRILATLLEPTSGEALVGGHSVLEEPEEVRRILGYMPDFFGVYDGMKVWEYLDFFAAAYRIGPQRRKGLIRDVLELTDLGPQREAFIESLSTGMKQRLCLAKTLLHDPAVLVLDEPASGLDPRARIELKELLRELVRMGKTLFVSSHILPELADFCNKVGILDQGRLVAAGTVEEILATVGQGHTRALRLRVLRNPEAALRLVEEFPGTERVRSEDGRILFDFYGGLEETARLAQAVVEQNLGLVELAEEATDLEDVFMRVTGAAS